MNKWYKNSEKNLLPLSEEQTHFATAIKEWSFTGEIIDHNAAIEVCELCEHESLRYHFLISNPLENHLWVGSRCIDKFDIFVMDELGNEVTEKKEQYLIKQVRVKHINTAFEKLIDTNPTGSLGVFKIVDLDQFSIQKYRSGESNARVLNYLFMRFEDEQIPFDKSFFSIRLNSDYSKRQLLKLNRKQYERIELALKGSQRKYYKENKTDAQI